MQTIVISQTCTPYTTDILELTHVFTKTTQDPNHCLILIPLHIFFQVIQSTAGYQHISRETMKRTRTTTAGLEIRTGYHSRSTYHTNMRMTKGI